VWFIEVYSRFTVEWLGELSFVKHGTGIILRKEGWEERFSWRTYVEKGRRIGTAREMRGGFEG